MDGKGSKRKRDTAEENKTIVAEQDKATDMCLPQLLKDLDNYLDDANNGFEDSSHLKDLLSNLKYKEEEWKKYIFESSEHYTRNLVASKDFVYDLILLCWMPGQKSAVHDHRTSGCWMRVLQGELTETRYRQTGTETMPGSLEKLTAETFSSPMTFYINNSIGVHSVANTGTIPAYSLHLYSPPITECEVWIGSQPHMFKTSLHSIYGIRMPSHMFKPNPQNRAGGKYWPLDRKSSPMPRVLPLKHGEKSLLHPWTEEADSNKEKL